MPRKPAVKYAFQVVAAIPEPNVLAKAKKQIALAANILNETFVWERTKEGYTYWRDACLALKRLSKAADMMYLDKNADVSKVRVYVKDEVLQKPEVKRATKRPKL